VGALSRVAVVTLAVRVAASAAISGVARAQEAPALPIANDPVAPAPTEPSPAAPPAVTAPNLRSSPDVAYPIGAHGDHVVVLELTVTLDGRAQEISIISGDEPFAAAARDAAAQWQFEPATRDGAAMPARIRFEVRFQEPSPPAPATTDATDSSPTPAAAPSAPIEVTVHGQRPPAVSASFSRAEVRQIPGTFGDPFRALETMPGVTPIASGAPYFFVRGAPPGNIGYFLDGIRVPLLYHVGFGPSVVHPGIVERVDLYPGAYPARYGRFAGAIVAAETTPPLDRVHGEGNIRLFDAGAMLEAPFADGRGAALAGGRYSYTALILSLVAPEVTLAYWDYQARVSYELTPRDTVSVFSFGAYDYLGEDDEDGKTTTLLGTEFHRIDLRYEKKVSESTRWRNAVAVGFDRSRGEEDSGPVVVDYLVMPRSEVLHRFDSGDELHVGIDATLDVYDVDINDDPGISSGAPSGGPSMPSSVPPPPPPVEAEPSSDEETDAEDVLGTRRDFSVGAFADVDWNPEPWVKVTPGLRFDLYTSGSASAFGVDPRLQVAYVVTNRLTLKHSIGIAHQPPSFAIPIPGFQPAGLRGGLQRSLQSSAGLEWKLPEDFLAQVTLFQNAYFNTSDILSVIRAQETLDNIDFDTRSTGHTFGVELFIKRALTRKLGGFLSYTLSRSMHSIGGTKFVTTFDRTHVSNLAAAYDLGRRWRAGSRFVFYTGIPTDVVSYGQGAPGRTPPFYRLDVRLEKRWVFSETYWWSFVIEVLNTTLNKEVFLDCNGADCEEVAIGPVTIPSIGVEAGF
jgi:TonB family protein